MSPWQRKAKKNPGYGNQLQKHIEGWGDIIIYMGWERDYEMNELKMAKSHSVE